MHFQHRTHEAVYTALLGWLLAVVLGTLQSLLKRRASQSTEAEQAFKTNPDTGSHLECCQPALVQRCVVYHLLFQAGVVMPFNAHLSKSLLQLISSYQVPSFRSSTPALEIQTQMHVHESSSACTLSGHTMIQADLEEPFHKHVLNPFSCLNSKASPLLCRPISSL